LNRKGFPGYPKIGLHLTSGVSDVWKTASACPTRGRTGRRGSAVKASGDAGIPAIDRTVQTQTVPEGRAFIFGTEQSAPLQLWHHLTGEILEALGQVGRYDVETVRAALHKPLLDQIRNRFYRPDGLYVTAGDAEPQHQLTDGEVLAAGQFQLLQETAAAIFRR